MIEQMLVVFAVLGGLIALLWLLRRKGLAQVSLPARKRARKGRELELLERLPLTATHSLHLVRAGKTVLLVGLSPSSCQALATLPAPPSAAPQPDPVLSWEGS
ncbi:MAG TPA: flagellar biosynthetic protein FliO [Bryobacteraceae bacterium]|nr:flagellar biosynthetic protein FliO [Bryobacteraceae bacterium]